jgi:TonB family protein
MRKWLVGVSLIVHIGVIFGLFVAGMWRLDRLDPEKHHIDLKQAPLLPAAASGSPKLAAQTFTPKRHITHDTVQPVERVQQTPVETTSDVTGTGTGSGDGPGDGSGTSGGSTCTTDCAGDTPTRPAVQIVEHAPTMIPPTVLKGMRISGETQIQPNDALKSQLLHEGASKLTAMIKVCVDTQGNVNNASQLRSTGYAAYDQELLGTVRTWRYRPYSVAGTAVPVCGIVTFNYEMR